MSFIRTLFALNLGAFSSSRSVFTSGSPSVSCLLSPHRCVSRVGTVEVLNYEEEEYEISLVMNSLQEKKDMKLVNPTSIVY